MDEKDFYLALCVVLAVTLVTSIAFFLKSYIRLLSRNKILRETIENLGRLNDRLRMDRHDYLNHLQVVYGLMELGEYENMDSYLRRVYRELLKTGKAIKTSKPAINALLAAKSAESEAKAIDFVIEVKSDLKALSIENWELCKVLSNLIDNALRALEDSPQAEKRIRIDITETPEKYVFKVENNGPEIPADMREKIFKRGFTTKKGEGHGMGLAIVSDILAENGGSIGLSSNEAETVFTVWLGKRGT